MKPPFVAIYKLMVLKSQIERAESLLTRDGFLKLVLRAQYMLGARWRTKIECLKMHYRAKVELKE